jgi:hypothetical protein
MCSISFTINYWYIFNFSLHSLHILISEISKTKLNLLYWKHRYSPACLFKPYIMIGLPTEYRFGVIKLLLAYRVLTADLRDDLHDIKWTKRQELRKTRKTKIKLSRVEGCTSFSTLSLRPTPPTRVPAVALLTWLVLINSNMVPCLCNIPGPRASCGQIFLCRSLQTLLQQ